MLLREFIRYLAAPLILGFALVISGGAAVGADLDEELLEQGRLLYEETAGDVGCATCHALDATGEAELGSPFIRGVARAQLDAALNGGVPDMDFFDLNRHETRAILAHLKYLAHSEEVITDPEILAGKLIFEETAGGVGCQSCHGIDATGDLGPDIRGAKAGAVRAQLKANADMQFIKLTKAEISQLVAYLDFVHSLEDH
ncbi:MAG: hypothetical protein ACC619_10020 [Paracoccaceae bacterium]